MFQHASGDQPDPRMELELDVDEVGSSGHGKK